MAEYGSVAAFDQAQGKAIELVRGARHIVFVLADSSTSEEGLLVRVISSVPIDAEAAAAVARELREQADKIEEDINA
jgi:hypothetical protein